MALQRNLTKRLFIFNSTSAVAVSRIFSSTPSGTLDRSILSPIPPNASKSGFLREYLTSSVTNTNGFFRRLLQHRATDQFTAPQSSSKSTTVPEFMKIPVGDELRERLKGMSILGKDRITLDGLVPPAREESAKMEGSEMIGGLTVEDTRRLLKVSQVESVKARLREVPKVSVGYGEFVRICVEACGEDDKQGLEFAKLLDESGNVIVLGNVVILRPEQVAKSMESLLSNTLPTPNDPRKTELEEMEKHKSIIDDKAQNQVRRELYFGLGLLTAQTLGFMRLTFWELSWDVMEPICFFVTSLHFALAYGFFLTTSTEPTFEGYFQRRFKSKQIKLMRKHKFDLHKYNHLSETLNPNKFGYSYSTEVSSGAAATFGRCGRGAVVGGALRG